ncbi:DUF5682 family protein [Rhodococcus sp. LW-XY12]|uniref:DUF5682 family protein n=1 Tax=Rhodococcus sp. LW-XY12 TaxID=2856851 RepID=UPI001C57DA6B|nr:DUF5682 family protein [Rhodococcus sp. LW-XY12]QXU52045.1 hypothetical protein KXC42_14100 [Rhodococcus sp. LW-XY12]
MTDALFDRADAPAEIRVFGIRHHGPGSARAVLQALAEFEPDTVLIEGPSDADPVLPLTVADDMVPPVALLAYARDEPARAAFWPFAAFTPEWQALRWAYLHDADVRFCDLPASMSLGAEREVGDRATDNLLGILARAGGYSDFEQWWDAVVEHGTAQAFDEITDAMRALREDVGIDDHTARREAHMRQVLRATVKAGARAIAVVCGAMHAPALTGRLGPAAPDARLLKGMPKVKTTLTWVPWSHSRLSLSSGYGAGITSPGWYHHLFTQPADTTARWFTRVARVLREEDLPVSSAHIIEATRLADTLAALRGRAGAGLDEVVEATRSVLCDGDAVLLGLVSRRLVVGEALGSVSEDTPTVPLDTDLQRNAKSLRLKRSAEARHLDLDLRREIDVARSRLLHRLALLGIDWGRPAESEVRSTGTFRETWTLRWEPELSVAIVEASRWGTTVESAAGVTVADRATRSGIALADLTELLERALLADLRTTIPSLVTAIDAAAALDHDVLHLMSALPTLVRTVRYGDVRGTDLSSLEHVCDALLARVCAGLPAAVTGLDHDAADALRTAIDDVHLALALREDPTATVRWLDTLTSVSERDDIDGLLVGRTTRMLRDTGRLGEYEASVRVARALSVGSSAPAKARWIDGFLGGGGLLLVHDSALFDLVDEWISGLTDDDFVDVLPVLRRTFGSFAFGERRLLGQTVRGERTRRTEAPPAVDRGRIALTATASILGVSA